MTWTAPDSGVYFVDFDISGFSYFYSFGTDSTFSRSSSKYYYSGKNSVAFTGASGVPQYWALGPYYASDTSDSYNVKISKGYELSVNVDASMGTINTDRKIALHKGRDTTITASSKVGYFFDEWSKVSGSVTIADVTALVNIILGKSENYDSKVADVNEDGSITIADVTSLVNIILGKTN